MLRHLKLDNFLLVEKADIAFGTGMTVLTGETGAGKSILINALSQVLGARASTELVRKPADKLMISAEFDVSHNPAVLAWLKQLDIDENEGTLVLRRTVSRDGKSQARVNDVVVTLGRLRELGDMLVDIYGQHSHQALIKPEYQRDRLDNFAGLGTVLADFSDAYAVLKALLGKQEALRTAAQARTDRMELLHYQLGELDSVSPQDGESNDLELEEQQLSSAETALTTLETVVAGISESDDALLDRVRHYEQDLGKLATAFPDLSPVAEALQGAAIQLDEAMDDLRQTIRRIDINPERLSAVQERLSSLYDLARKHQCEPEMLATVHQQLQAEHDTLAEQSQDMAAIEEHIIAQRDKLAVLAQKLSAKRKTAATKLSKAVTAQIRTLGMEGATFKVDLVANKAGEIATYGAEQIKFVLEANPGQGFSAVGSSASGGELARIGLALQVITTADRELPVKVFDEVDTGIGGKTADTVGGLLKELSSHAQILCITHLAQVAVKGNHHLKIQKNLVGKQVFNTVDALVGEARTEEIARMLGGSKISSKTLSHAAELLGE
jgi:DNA repair protein RecN (Recombination protein N)